MAQLNKSISKPLHPIFSEKAIFFSVLLLAGLGIIMVYSASSGISIQKFNNNFHYLQRQALFCLISFGVLIFAASFPYKFLRPLSYIIFLTSIVLLIAVLIPSINIEAGGAHRWISLGSITFQPAEFAKLALIIFLSYSLSKKQELITSYTIGFFPHLIIFGLFAILILIQPDFGSVIILGMITWGMMFIAGVPILHLLSPIPFLVPILYFAVYKVSYRMDRIFAFLNPWDDPFNTGYQITHSLKAFGSGGLFGKGLGLSIAKLHYLPEPHTDFIFSIIGEELGLIGVLSVFILYSIILIRGAKIARTSENVFGSMVAAGLTISLALQVIINTGVALGTLPTKGLTLPFLSYGGTSLLINMAAIGILINIGASVKDD
jgi:cell division protein FtsW